MNFTGGFNALQCVLQHLGPVLLTLLSHIVIMCSNAYEGLQTSEEADHEEERGGGQSSGLLHTLK